MTKMLNRHENINIANVIGIIMISLVIFMISCLHTGIYEEVIVGILTGCLVGSFISYANYVNEKEDFFDYTVFEIRNNLIKISTIEKYLENLIRYILNTNTLDRDELYKLAYLNLTEHTLNMTAVLSNSIQIWFSKVAKYDDLAMISSSVIIPAYKNMENKNIVNFLDEIMKNSFNRRMEHSLFTIYSELKNIQYTVLPIASEIHNNWLNIQIMILRYMKDNEEENIFLNDFNEKINELKQRIKVINAEFSQGSNRTMEAMNLFVRGTRYAEVWSIFEKEFKAQDGESSGKP